MPAKADTILLLGGTAEAAEMAARLVDRGFAVTTSLAGRTREPVPLKGCVRTGGFAGAEGLAAYLRESGVTLLIDMTHPFATRMSANARAATELAKIPLLHWQRPGWSKMDGDQWIQVPGLTAAVSAIPYNARVLLALGSQHIAPFSARQDVHFLVRMVDCPAIPLPLPDHELLIGKPGSVEAEFAILQEKSISHVVCRNSGGKASYAKIAAARLLNLPVIMVERSDTSASNTTLDTFEAQILAALTGKPDC